MSRRLLAPPAVAARAASPAATIDFPSRTRPAVLKLIYGVERDAVTAEAGGGLWTPTPAPLDVPIDWLSDEAADAAPPKLRFFPNGRIAGVVAPEGRCLLDGSGECWVVPRPADGRGSKLCAPNTDDGDYYMAHVGSTMTDHGEVATAVLAGPGGHADPHARASTARRHYDDTDWQVGRGRYVWSDKAGGLCFVGAAWPEVTPRQVAAIRASAASVDYRWIEDERQYRLIATCLVNVGGFPSRYASLVDDGFLLTAERLLELADELGIVVPRSRAAGASVPPALEGMVIDEMFDRITARTAAIDPDDIERDSGGRFAPKGGGDSGGSDSGSDSGGGGDRSHLSDDEIDQAMDVADSLLDGNLNTDASIAAQELIGRAESMRDLAPGEENRAAEAVREMVNSSDPGGTALRLSEVARSTNGTFKTEGDASVGNQTGLPMASAGERVMGPLGPGKTNDLIIPTASGPVTGNVVASSIGGSSQELVLLTTKDGAGEKSTAVPRDAIVGINGKALRAEDAYKQVQQARQEAKREARARRASPAAVSAVIAQAWPRALRIFEAWTASPKTAGLTESGLVSFANDELYRAGLMDADSDYDGMLGDAVLELVRVFADQGHSGMSAAMTSDILNSVLRYQPLTPLTYAPDEWNHVAEDMAGRSGGVWQNRRDGAVFSEDGGATWYSVEDPDRVRHPGWDAAKAAAGAPGTGVSHPTALPSDREPAQEDPSMTTKPCSCQTLGGGGGAHTAAFQVTPIPTEAEMVATMPAPSGLVYGDQVTWDGGLGMYSDALKMADGTDVLAVFAEVGGILQMDTPVLVPLPAATKTESMYSYVDPEYLPLDNLVIQPPDGSAAHEGAEPAATETAEGVDDTENDAMVAGAGARVPLSQMTVGARLAAGRIPSGSAVTPIERKIGEHDETVASLLASVADMKETIAGFQQRELARELADL